MQPFGNRPYDRAKAWERTDNVETEEVVNTGEDRFNRHLMMELEKAIDEAHVQLAKHGMAATSASQPLSGAEFTREGPGKTANAAALPDSNPELLSNLAQKGRDYLRVREELRKIKHLARQRGLSVREIHRENPDLLVWTFANSLSPEDRDVFEHPGTWEAGYAVNVFLAKYYCKSPATMKKWAAAFRQESPLKRPSQGN